VTPRFPSVSPKKAVRARDLARGTLLHIVEASGVTRDEFMDLL
jgi:hypothetical protein